MSEITFIDQDIRDLIRVGVDVDLRLLRRRWVGRSNDAIDEIKAEFIEAGWPIDAKAIAMEALYRGTDGRLGGTVEHEQIEA